MAIKLIKNWGRIKIDQIVTHAKKISLPGFHGVPIYDVGFFYLNGISNGAIGVRASAISFNFFLALFPSIIFVFTAIAFIPVDNFQLELIQLIEKILPSNTYQSIESTIIDITTERRGSLLSFGFFAALLFSTNGIAALIASFNASANDFENRKWVSMRLIAIFLVMVLFLLITIATGTIIFGKLLLLNLVNLGILQNKLSLILFVIGQWAIITTLILFCISFLYYFAPSRRSEFKFLSPGSIMATILIILSSLAFSYYLSRFGQYNKLYGSIGTLIALLVWMEINSFVLLIGFELNVSIRNALIGVKKDLKLSDYARDSERFFPKKEDLLKDN